MKKLHIIVSMLVLLLGSTVSLGIQIDKELWADSSDPSNYDDWSDDDCIGIPGPPGEDYDWSYDLDVYALAEVNGNGSGWAVAYAEASVSGIASYSVYAASTSFGPPDTDSRSDAGTKKLYYYDTLDLDVVVALQVDWFSGANTEVRAAGVAVATGSIE